jgi:hypothetical protein
LRYAASPCYVSAAVGLAARLSLAATVTIELQSPTSVTSNFS